MASVMCHCVHDSKYRQFLETDKYPNSVFELTVPISLTTVPAPNQIITVPITGNFTIHGVTRSQTFTLKATRIDGRIALNGSLPIQMSDYNIHPPSAGSFRGVSNCDIDLLIAFEPSGLAPTRSAVDP